jgi:DNA-directed RNA polymerase specialized sigma54-like protein
LRRKNAAIADLPPNAIDIRKELREWFAAEKVAEPLSDREIIPRRYSARSVAIATSNAGPM